MIARAVFLIAVPFFVFMSVLSGTVMNKRKEVDALLVAVAIILSVDAVALMLCVGFGGW